MQTDPISAAAGYRLHLERVAGAVTLHEARKHAVAGLAIQVAPPGEQQVSVRGGVGQTSGEPFVTLAISTPAVQIASAQARAIALQILEAADAAESDGFLTAWLRGNIALADGQIGALLQEFRAYREGQREKE